MQRTIVRELRMAERAAEKIRKLRDAEIRKQRRLGRSLAAIALEYGVSRERVRQIAGVQHTGVYGGARARR